MSKKGYKISISSPCQENWGNMSVLEKGKFCSTCQKAVIDFTLLSDHEIYTLLSKSSGGLCGRVDRRQTERMVIPLNTKAKPLYKFYRMLAGFFIMSSLHQKIFADTGKSIQDSTFVETQDTDLISKVSLGISDDSLYIEGKVRDSKTLEAVAAAIVYIDSSHSAPTDHEGNFRIKIPPSSKADTIFIQIHSTGYDIQEYSIALNQLPVKTEFYLFPSVQIIMGGIVHCERVAEKRNWWNPFGKKKPRYQRVR